MLFKDKKFTQEQPHFSIRKLSAGAASVLIGISLIGITNQSVKADTTSEPATEETAKNNEEVQSTADGKATDTISKTTTSSDGTNSAALKKYPTENAVQSKNQTLTESSTASSTAENNTQNEALESLADAKKAPAVQPSKDGGQNSKGEDISGINSQVSITGKNKYTGETSSSSAKGVVVNPSITEDLNMVITLNNDNDVDKAINTSFPSNAYALPAYYGIKGANIVVDGSRVSTANGKIEFGGTYQNSDVKISNWDKANEVGSTGYNNSPETIADLIKDLSLIGGFQLSGNLKARQTVTIIVPLKFVTPDQKSGGNTFERQYGQAVVVSVDPEGGRQAGDYTSVNSSVDTLVEDNIANLADNNGNLTLNTDITNGGFLTHQETLEFNLSNLANFDNNHQVQVVLDHTKEIGLDWVGTNGDNVQYKVNGTYKTASQMTNSDWDNVTAIKVTADLASGSTGKVSIPVKVKNADQIKSDLNNQVNLNQSNLRQNTISVQTAVDNTSIGNAKTTTYYYELPATATMNAVDQNIDHQVAIRSTFLVIDSNGERHYIDIPEIQNLMPYLDKDDYIYQNVGHTDSSQILFTDGVLKIKLEKIFNAFKNQGYSVNITNVNNKESTWPVYSYNVASAGKVILYVQLQNIFNTKDLNLTTNDTWNSNDSLVSANVEFYSEITMGLTGSKNLKATGDYTYDLYDPAGNRIATNVPVGQNIGKLSVGRYRVVYHYAINGDEVVSKEAYINVSEPAQPDQPISPEQPTTPVQPSTPTDSDNNNVTPLPENPVSPTTPVAPSTPNRNSDNKSDNVRPHSENTNKGNNKNQTVTPKNTSVSGVVTNKSTKLANVHSQANSQEAVKNNDNTLPQTGEKKQASTGIFGLLAAALGIFGLAFTKRRARK